MVMILRTQFAVGMNITAKIQQLYPPCSHLEKKPFIHISALDLCWVPSTCRFNFELSGNTISQTSQL